MAECARRDGRARTVRSSALRALLHCLPPASAAARPPIVAQLPAGGPAVDLRVKLLVGRWAAGGNPTSVTMRVMGRDGHMRITPAGGRLGGRRGGHGQLAKLREPECEPVRHGGPARLTKPGGLSLPGDCHHDDDSGLPGNQPGPLNQAVRIYSLTGRLALRLARQVHSRSQDPAVPDVPVEQWL